MIAPQDEVLFASLITGIATIGLSVFALATDIDIARTWAAVPRATSPSGSGRKSPARPGADALRRPDRDRSARRHRRRGDARGRRRNGGAREHLEHPAAARNRDHQAPLRPGSSALWVGLALMIGGEEAQDKLLDALPVVGQVIAVLEVGRRCDHAGGGVRGDDRLAVGDRERGEVDVSGDDHDQPRSSRRDVSGDGDGRIGWRRRSMARSCSIRSRRRSIRVGWRSRVRWCCR